MKPTISIACPKCKKRLTAKAEFAGKKIRCPNCKQPILIRNTPTKERFRTSPETHPDSAPTDSPLKQTPQPLTHAQQPTATQNQASAKSPKGKWFAIAAVPLVILALFAVSYFVYLKFNHSQSSSSADQPSTAEASNPNEVAPPETQNQQDSDDILFADFNDGTYGDWQQEGVAFGASPRDCDVADHRQDIFVNYTWPINGSGVADSLFSDNRVLGPQSTGRLTSPQFEVKHKYINFMAAGRIDYVQLVVDGKVVRQGQRDEKIHFDRISPIAMDVDEFKGKVARIQVVDDGSAFRNHVCVDHFVFSNSDLSESWEQQCIENAKQQAVMIRGRQYYFGPRPVMYENAQFLAQLLGGQLLTLESEEETQAILPFLKGDSWTGVTKQNEIWQNEHGDVYTHVDWGGHDTESIPGSRDQHAYLTADGQYSPKWNVHRYPVIEFGDKQTLPKYRLSASDENRALAEMLLKAKAPFILATENRFLYQWQNLASEQTQALPSEPFEVQHITLPAGFTVSDDTEKLFAFSNKIRHLKIIDGTDETLRLIKHLKELRSLVIDKGDYKTWAGLSALPNRHPMRKFEFRSTKFTAQQISPLFRAKALRGVSFHATSLSPELGELLAQHKDSLVAYWSNACYGLGREGFQALADCQQLRYLMLWASDVRDEDFVHLGKLEQLEEIQLGANYSISGKELSNITGWKKLHNLSLWGNPIENQSLSNMPVLPRLRKLNIAKSKVSEDGLTLLAKLPALEHLDISETSVDDQQARQLLECKQLKMLEAKGTSITADGLSDFHEKMPGFRANISEAAVVVPAAPPAIKIQDSVSQTEPEFVNWVKSIGGTVTEDDGIQVTIPPSANFSSADMRRFKNLPNLTSLNISQGQIHIGIQGTPVKDVDILQLTELPKLRRIVLGGSDLTDKAMKHLSLFPIKELSVFRSPVTAKGLNYFKQHKLERVDAIYCRFLTEQQLEPEVLAHVVDLNLTGTSATNLFFNKLQQNQVLKQLWIRETKMTPDVCEEIKQFDSLNSLELSDLNLKDEHLLPLSSLTQLEALAVGKNKLTSQGIQFIASKFDKLIELDVSHNKISPSLAIDWSNLQSLETLLLCDTPINDSQLLAISKIENLKGLAIDDINSAQSEITASGFETFGRRLPDCRILTADGVPQTKSSSVSITLATDSQKHNQDDADSAIVNFLQQNKIPERPDLIKAIEDAVAKKPAVGMAQIVVGKLELPKNCNHEEVVCQTPILSDGYFVDLIRASGVPIRFWHPRCQVAQCIPQAGPETFNWLGNIPVKPDRERAKLIGIIREGYYDIPKDVKISVSCKLSFISSFDDVDAKKSNLEKRLDEIADTKTQFNPRTGLFEVENLIDAPIELLITSDNEKLYREIVFPLVGETADLGICNLDRPPVPGALPNLQDIEPASPGTEKLQQIMKQLQDRSGNSPGGVRFHETLKRKAYDSVIGNANAAAAKTWIKANGDRSAVAVYGLIDFPGIDLTQVKSHLSVDQAIYLPQSTNYAQQVKSVPRLISGTAKPGDTISISVPGFSPFEYQVKGSSDGIEVIEDISFKPLNNRSFGTIEVQRSQPDVNYHLQFDAPRHSNTLGQTWMVPRPLIDSSRNVAQSTGIKGVANDKSINYGTLPTGCYELTLFSNENCWSRQIGLKLDPRLKLQVPTIPIYKIQSADLEFCYQIQTANDSKKLLSFENSKVISQTVTPERVNRQASFISGYGGLNRRSGLNWTGHQEGNTLKFEPRFYEGNNLIFDNADQSWKIVQLGRGDLQQYKTIQTNVKQSFPKLTTALQAPFRLASGSTYLLQKHGKDRNTISVLVHVK